MWSRDLVSPTKVPRRARISPRDTYKIHCTDTICEIMSQGSHCVYRNVPVSFFIIVTMRQFYMVHFEVMSTFTSFFYWRKWALGGRCEAFLCMKMGRTDVTRNGIICKLSGTVMVVSFGLTFDGWHGTAGAPTQWIWKTITPKRETEF